MSIRDESYRQQVERHENAERAARRDSRRALMRFALEVLMATMLGLLLMGAALHTDDVGTGRIYWLGGQIAWLAGLVVAVTRARNRAAARGDGERPL